MAALHGSLRDIRLFVSVCSFTAQRENATQFGVPQHGHNLETAFGVPHFVRDKGRIVPTAAGDVYSGGRSMGCGHTMPPPRRSGLTGAGWMAGSSLD
jgi:hypothetical protein